MHIVVRIYKYERPDLVSIRCSKTREQAIRSLRINLPDSSLISCVWRILNPPSASIKPANQELLNKLEESIGSRLKDPDPLEFNHLIRESNC